MEVIRPISDQTAITILSGPLGSFAYLRSNVPDIKGSYLSDKSDYKYVVATGPKGVWSRSTEESVVRLKKTILTEIRRLEKNGDLRPSDTKRLEFLRSVI